MKSNDIGKIKSLALRDFLTYDELKYIPGDNLNIIIGPNGTGKSTIVAGIILGCGGKPILLSRSKDISDYVKNGKTKAHVEIELVSGNKGTVSVFHRTFDKESKEAFSINGKVVSYKEYLNQIKKFNIQVDNLCMFLPQDRVQDFTKLNPQELLNNTQISVCTQEINEAFQSLLKKREMQKNDAKTNAEIQTRLDDNRNRNEQLRSQIENSHLKDKLIQKVEILAKKKAWKELEDLQNRYKEEKNDMKSADKIMKKVTDEMIPLLEKQKSISGAKTALKNAISKASTDIKASHDEIERLRDATDKIENDVEKAKQNMRNTIESAKNHAKEVSELELAVNLEKTAVETAKQELTEDGDIQEKMQMCDDEIAQVKGQLEQKMNRRLGIMNNLEETVVPSLRNCERKLATLMDTQRQRVEILRNYEDPFRAYEWLKSNRQHFQGKIFNPIMVEITVKEKDNAKYVENTIAMKDLHAFVCTDKNDMKQLIQKLRVEMNLQVNIAYAEDTNEVEFQSSQCITDYPQEFGLYSYLIDMIDGPAPIINYLCKLYRIHEVAVGDDQTFENASRLPNNFRLFFSTNHRFQVTVSRYSGAKSTTSSMIQPRNILNVGVDTRMKAREEANLMKWKKELQEKQNLKTQCENEIDNFEQQIADIRATKKTFQQKIHKVKLATDRCRKKQLQLDNLINRKIDLEAERKKFKDNVDSLIAKILQVTERKVASLLNYKKNVVQRVLATKKLEVFEISTGNVDEAIRLQQREIDNKRNLYEIVKRNYESIKMRLKAKEKQALELTDGIPPTHKNFKYKSKFDKLPNSVEELQNQIEEHQGRIDCIPGVDPRIAKEYEERAKEIKDLEHQLSNEKERLDKLEKDIQDLHNKWYPAIQDIIGTINTNFSNFFNKMGFVGEVEMTRKDERDYADYGIQIRVQYRDNERLQALNRHVQSGGERAVAIAVYTLSLQHLTSVPFRCVDEINQGMDPKNERKIFQMLVDITCQPGQSQYFFVTPKLLTDLPHSDLMTISVVHNGEHIEDPYLFLNSEGEDVEMESDDE